MRIRNILPRRWTEAKKGVELPSNDGDAPADHRDNIPQYGMCYFLCRAFQLLVALVIGGMAAYTLIVTKYEGSIAAAVGAFLSFTTACQTYVAVFCSPKTHSNRFVYLADVICLLLWIVSGIAGITQSFPYVQGWHIDIGTGQKIFYHFRPGGHEDIILLAAMCWVELFLGVLHAMTLIAHHSARHPISVRGVFKLKRRFNGTERKTKFTARQSNWRDKRPQVRPADVERADLEDVGRVYPFRPEDVGRDVPRRQESVDSLSSLQEKDSAEAVFSDALEVQYHGPCSQESGDKVLQSLLVTSDDVAAIGPSSQTEAVDLCIKDSTRRSQGGEVAKHTDHHDETETAAANYDHYWNSGSKGAPLDPAVRLSTSVPEAPPENDDGETTESLDNRRMSYFKSSENSSTQDGSTDEGARGEILDDSERNWNLSQCSSKIYTPFHEKSDGAHQLQWDPPCNFALDSHSELETIESTALKESTFSDGVVGGSLEDYEAENLDLDDESDLHEIPEEDDVSFSPVTKNPAWTPQGLFLDDSDDKGWIKTVSFGQGSINPAVINVPDWIKTHPCYHGEEFIDKFSPYVRLRHDRPYYPSQVWIFSVDAKPVKSRGMFTLTEYAFTSRSRDTFKYVIGEVAYKVTRGNPYALALVGFLVPSAVFLPVEDTTAGEIELEIKQKRGHITPKLELEAARSAEISSGKFVASAAVFYSDPPTKSPDPVPPQTENIEEELDRLVASARASNAAIRGSVNSGSPSLVQANHNGGSVRVQRETVAEFESLSSYPPTVGSEGEHSLNNNIAHTPSRPSASAPTTLSRPLRSREASVSPSSTPRSLESDPNIAVTTSILRNMNENLDKTTAYDKSGNKVCTPLAPLGSIKSPGSSPPSSAWSSAIVPTRPGNFGTTEESGRPGLGLRDGGGDYTSLPRARGGTSKPRRGPPPPNHRHGPRRHRENMRPNRSMPRDDGAHSHYPSRLKMDGLDYNAPQVIDTGRTPPPNFSRPTMSPYHGQNSPPRMHSPPFIPRRPLPTDSHPCLYIPQLQPPPQTQCRFKPRAGPARNNKISLPNHQAHTQPMQTSYKVLAANQAWFETQNQIYTEAIERLQQKLIPTELESCETRTQRFSAFSHQNYHNQRDKFEVSQGYQDSLLSKLLPSPFQFQSQSLDDPQRPQKPDRKFFGMPVTRLRRYHFREALALLEGRGSKRQRPLARLSELPEGVRQYAVQNNLRLG